MKVKTYCGGIAQTNGYLLLQDGKALIVDAPDGMAHWLKQLSKKEMFHLVALLVTHGHWDHIVDAATIQQHFKIPILIHRDSAPLLENPSIQSAFNPFYPLPSCKADKILTDETYLQLPPFNFQILLCPGHCPGSLCFYFQKEKMLFGGDVLFAGGIGRWDLPGCSEKDLFEAIEKKILVLPDTTQVFPGHGETTTIGEERQTNPFLLHLQK